MLNEFSKTVSDLIVENNDLVQNDVSISNDVSFSNEVPIQNDVFVENNVSVPGIDDVHVSDEKVSNDNSSTKHSESLTGEEETINYSEKAPDENCTVDRFTSIKGKHKEDAILVPDENSPVKAKVGDNSSKNKRIWRNLPNKKFFLSFSDKNDIRYDKKLNSDIINFSLGLLSSQFPDIHGFQNCGYAPVRENGRWKYGLKMKQVSAPCTQIHHTGNDHWLVSFQDEPSGDIHVADSMSSGQDELSTSVDMQFLQMYGRGKLNISLLKVQQQRNSIDCGIFAIAFCTEFCYTGRKGVLHAEFDVVKMRGHLANCMENMELTPFPKVIKRLKLRKQKEKVFNYSISADCAALCDYPNSFNDMVQCDNKTCQKWYHYICAGLDSPTDSLLWVCNECQS